MGVLACLGASFSAALTAEPGQSGSVPPPLPRDVYVLVAFMDGVPPRVFDRALQDGGLPNIEKYVLDRGCRAGTGLSLFPTVTFSTQPGSVTGLFPGHYSIPGLKWFKRDKRSKRDHLSFDNFRFEDDLALYSPKQAALEHLMEPPETVFTRLSGHRTASVQMALGRDAEVQRFFLARLCAGKIFPQFPHLTDRGIGDYLTRLYASPATQPRFCLVCFPDYDPVAHVKGPESPEAVAILRQFDGIMGRIVEAMRTGGIFDKTYVVLLSDHGFTPVGKNNVVNYRHVLEHAGLRPRERQEEGFDCLVASNSLSSVAIYVADPVRQWGARPGYPVLRRYPVRNTGQYVDLLQILADQPGTDFLVVGDGPGRVRVLDRNSELVITRRMFLGESYYMLRLERGTADPWDYLANPELARMTRSAEFHSGAEWLGASAQSHYPDAVVQCVQIFDSFRCGDVFISLQPGWKCKASNYIATHGSMFHMDMSVPFIVSGPDIRQAEFPAARLVDVYPTTLRLFGLSIPFGVLDGRPLDEILPPDLCRETDPNDELRVALLPAVRQLWALEATSAGQPLLPHHYPDALRKTPANLRLRIANLLRTKRLRLAARLDDPEAQTGGQAGREAVESLLRTEEQELSRQIQWFDGGRTGDLSEHPIDSASGTQ